MRNKQEKYSQLFLRLCAVVLCSIIIVNMEAQVTLSTDFTIEANREEALHDIWSVANRISPTNGSNVRPGTDINLVRMIGGILKTVDGKKVPDYDYDPCSYDSVNNVYVYNWTSLLDRVGKIVNGQTKLHQIVLDQPPWAFQHGYEFIPEGTIDSVHFRENERITHYGNSLPPKDKEAYFDFIKAMIEKFIETFGQEEVMSWRFRVGSEIETPDHWPGTAQDFVEHFANTEKAVRSVLPNAIIGVHTRTPGFLYKNGEPKNYKGEPYASFANNIIEYCYDNDVQYDFWGISDYVLINGENHRDISTKYDTYFKDLQEHPKWNPNATLDMMEYSTVITMNPPDGGVFLNCATTHKDIIELGISHMFYRKGIDKVFRWGLRNGQEDFGPISDLRNMVGDFRYETTKSGSPNTSTNQLDAIYTTNEAGDKYDVILYNYNAKSLNYVSAEPVRIAFSLDLPVGSKLYYRNNSFSIEQNKLQQFLLKEGNSWVKSGWDEKGEPDRTLTSPGYDKYQAFTEYKPLVFNEWKSVVSIERTDGGEGSMVLVDADIPSFAYKKFEFRLESEFVSEITPLDVRWTSTEDFAPWEARRSGMTVKTDNDKLTLTFSEGDGFPMAGITGLNIPSELFDTMRMVLKNSTPEANFQLAANVPGSGFETGRIRPSFPNDSQTHVLIVDLSSWTQWDGVITDFKIYNKVNSGTLEIDTIEFIPGAEAETVDVTVEQEGLGLLNYSSGSCFAGQEFIFNAIPESGWAFIEWTADVTSSVNPLNIKMDSSMTINAIFKETFNVLIEQEGSGTLSHSSGIYTDGQEMILTATPAPGWEFDGWTGDTISSENPITLSINSDFNINAVFIEPVSVIENLATTVNAYPNPNSTGKYNLNKISYYEVYSIEGIKVTSGVGRNVDISYHPKGIYILQTGESFHKIVFE